VYVIKYKKLIDTPCNGLVVKYNALESLILRLNLEYLCEFESNIKVSIIYTTIRPLQFFFNQIYNLMCISALSMNVENYYKP